MQEVGDITLILENNNHLELKDCLCIPESKKNLILVSSLNKSFIHFISMKVFLLERIIHLFAQVH